MKTFTFITETKTVTVFEKNEKRALRKALKDPTFAGAWRKDNPCIKEHQHDVNKDDVQNISVLTEIKNFIKSVNKEETLENIKERVINFTNDSMVAGCSHKEFYEGNISYKFSFQVYSSNWEMRVYRWEGNSFGEGENIFTKHSNFKIVNGSLDNYKKSDLHN